MTISISSLTASYDNVDATSYVTSSISPAANSFLLVAIMSSAAAAGTAPVVDSITGLSLTWTQITDRAFSGTGSAERRIALWRAQCGASPGSGALTIDHGGATSIGTGWIVDQVTGHDTTTPIVQSPTNSGAAATSGSVTLSTEASSENRPYSAFMHRANEGKTPRTNWTELNDTFGGTPSIGLETQWRSDTFETTASASWVTSQPWGAIAVEIAKAASALSPPPRHFRTPNIGR